MNDSKHNNGFKKTIVSCLYYLKVILGIYGRRLARRKRSVELKFLTI